ncbi:hypothetical protein KZX45_16445 [Georgenia sp. EYE_87]|uniref:hypothetical protein n=1 Tax=Georgenia sp. EYE_87 TaxID=2853448 RepID=UPI0020056F61|nr:hypothetical protein [Georgenia sp. EYE_87]MCK6212134.1 hypothetical protein [Georgenia sp. EYE_87]
MSERNYFLDMLNQGADEAYPGWRPLLRTLRDMAGRHPVHGIWMIDDPPWFLITTSAPRTPAGVRVAVATIGAAMTLTCDRCGGLGRPVPVGDGWGGGRCGEHDPTAPDYYELWEALGQDVWFRDFEVGMVRVEEMTSAQRRDAIERLLKDPAGLADEAQRTALYRAGRDRDRDAFEAALLLPADDEDEARRVIEESPLVRALHRESVEHAAQEVIARYADLLQRLADPTYGDDEEKR